MTSVLKLMGSAMPAAQASRLGFAPATLAGVGTAQTGAAAITQLATIMTTSGGATAFVLPQDDAGAGPFWVFNSSSTTALLFPDSGSNINGGSPNASVNIVQNKPAILLRLSSTLWAMTVTG